MRFLHNNLYPLWAALALIAAASCWYSTTVPAVPKAQVPAPLAWSLPKPREVESKKMLDAINSRNMWGAALASNVPPPPVWNVLGIARHGEERFILMAYEGKPVEVLKVGDSLPDGEKIVQIEADRFFVLTPEKKKLAFGIYKNDIKK